jgi:protein-tyrosine phosphatase
MLDLHSHILFDLDDGPRRIEDSLEMCRIAAKDGVGAMVATPHFLSPLFDVTPERARDRFDALSERLRDEGIPLEIRLGGELYCVPEIAAHVRDGRAPTLAGGRAVLVELPYEIVPAHFAQALFELQSAGLRVVLAHPERYVEVRERPQFLDELRDRGVWLQITAGAVLGDFGPTEKKTCRRLLEEGRVHVIASDSHTPLRRPPGLREAEREAARIVGPSEAQKLVDANPRRVVDGEPLA